MLHRAIIPVRMIQIKSELTEIQALSLCFVCNFIIANQNIIIAKRKMLIAKTNMLMDYFFIGMIKKNIAVFATINAMILESTVMTFFDM